MTRARPLLTLYIRPGCHLCEDMQQQLGVELQGRAVDVETVDITASDELELLYGRLVPVLKGGEKEICHYFLDAVALHQYLSHT